MTEAAIIHAAPGNPNRLPEDIREGLRQFRRSSRTLAALMFIPDVFAYAACFALVAAPGSQRIAKAVASILLGVLITRLSIIGHDAAHGSLVKSRWLNDVLGRLAFLPALHPYSLWQVGHNRVHHSFTNLKGLDFIWIPFSPDEYRRFPRWRQWIERFYRSVAGFGIYYMVEIWWKYLSFKGARMFRAGMARNVADTMLVLGFLAFQTVLVFRSTPHPMEGILLSIVIPFFIWNWLMGFIIYNHHTSPSVRFFSRRSEWRFYEGQVQGSVHTIFPRPFGFLLNHIMEHTAHHVDVGIPCYRLRAAQRYLERRLPGGLVIEKWSMQTFFETLRTCQLYDYDRHQWLTFAGARNLPETKKGLI